MFAILVSVPRLDLITLKQSSKLGNEHHIKENCAAALISWIESKVLEITANYHTLSCLEIAVSTEIL